MSFPGSFQPPVGGWKMSVPVERKRVAPQKTKNLKLTTHFVRHTQTKAGQKKLYPFFQSAFSFLLAPFLRTHLNKTADQTPETQASSISLRKEKRLLENCSRLPMVMEFSDIYFIVAVSCCGYVLIHKEKQGVIQGPLSRHPSFSP